MHKNTKTAECGKPVGRDYYSSSPFTCFSSRPFDHRHHLESAICMILPHHCTNANTRPRVQGIFLWNLYILFQKHKLFLHLQFEDVSLFSLSLVSTFSHTSFHKAAFFLFQSNDLCFIAAFLMH